MRIDFFDADNVHLCTVNMELPNVGERVFLYPENPPTILESVRPVSYTVAQRDFIARPGKESYVEVHLTKEEKKSEQEGESNTLSCEELSYLKSLEKGNLNDCQPGWGKNEAIREKLEKLKLVSVKRHPASYRTGDLDSWWCKITAKGRALINKK